MLSDAVAKRFEVQSLERAVGPQFAPSVRDQQLAVDEEDVGFDAGEAVIERIEQRPLVKIVVVSVGLCERRDVSRAGRRRNRNEEGNKQQGTWHAGYSS